MVRSILRFVRELLSRASAARVNTEDERAIGYYDGYVRAVSDVHEGIQEILWDLGIDEEELPEMDDE